MRKITYPPELENLTPDQIKTVHDLKGKIVTGTRPGASADSALRLYLRKAGLEPGKDVIFISVGESQQGRLNALHRGSVAATALYGPQAAALVEMFPTRVRYTAMSLPYHVGTGWIGGFLPVTSFALVAITGDIYASLWYPVVFTVIPIVVSFFFLNETRGKPLEEV